jgi:hypothetical protein
MAMKNFIIDARTVWAETFGTPGGAAVAPKQSAAVQNYPQKGSLNDEFDDKMPDWNE